MDGLLAFGWLPIIVASAGSAAIMIAGGILTETGPWYKSLIKPSWQPPDWAFAPVWTVIYILNTLGTILAWNNADTTAERFVIVTAFVLNGLLNIGWSLLFFRWRRPDLARLEVVCLWLSTVLLGEVYAMAEPSAGWLIVPYVVWVSIAAYLNHTVVRLNRPLAEAPRFKQDAAPRPV
jgi:tryptophan-rich sensory protein